jgi:small subunit ribosomal protein S34
MTSAVEKAIRAFLPRVLPPSLSQNAGNLYQVLSRTPPHSTGKKVYQTRWRAKQIQGCYWLVTRTQFKCEGKHGKAWGKLYWKGESDLWLMHSIQQRTSALLTGKLVSSREERVRGALKHNWQEGIS